MPVVDYLRSCFFLSLSLACNCHHQFDSLLALFSRDDKLLIQIVTLHFSCEIALHMSDKLDLKCPVQYLPGVGPARAEKLHKLGLLTATDVLFFFHRDYEDTTLLCAIDELEANVPASVRGRVEEVDSYNSDNGRGMVGVLIRQGGSYLRAIWFNQPFRSQIVRVGQEVEVSGVPRMSGLRWEMAHPKMKAIEADPAEQSGSISPVYRLTEGLKQREIRRIAQATVEKFVAEIPEVFPEPMLKDKNLVPIVKALKQIHFPENRAELEKARRRFVYQELLILQLGLAMRRQRLIFSGTAPKMDFDERLRSRITRLFPFDLTESQQAAFNEIVADLRRSFPMNRLLQGDVGSGKTVVAMAAMLTAVANEYQAILMAPTELLANQHYKTLTKLLEHSRVRTGLLTGSIGAAARRKLLTEIAEQQLDFIIGTQAVINAEIVFKKLGLVIIDEQHRFGVRQRAVMKQAGFDPHYLIMTATPIPRSVSMTIFGNLDVSNLRDAPAGRQQVYTYRCQEDQRGKWWEFVRKKLQEGRQCFVITPRINDSEDSDQTSVNAAYEHLANGELEQFRLDVLHGGQSSAEKDLAMQRFADGQTQVLISTSVVEVGIDVPNATIMTIESAERFGLAQLHQFRGRVSRGSFAGYVGVFAAAQTPESEERLQAFVEINDGFKLAEIDFKLRGPGDLFGTRQHGLPPLRVADLRTDGDLLEEARQDAKRITQNDPELRNPDYARLRRMVIARYGAVMELGDVG